MRAAKVRQANLDCCDPTGCTSCPVKCSLQCRSRQCSVSIKHLHAVQPATTQARGSDLTPRTCRRKEARAGECSPNGSATVSASFVGEYQMRAMHGTGVKLTHVRHSPIRSEYSDAAFQVSLAHLRSLACRTRLMRGSEAVRGALEWRRPRRAGHGRISKLRATQETL